MQIEVKLKSGPVFDFGGPWGRGHPRGAAQKAKILKFNMLAVLLPNFRALALNIDGGDSRQKRSLRIVARIIRIRRIIKKKDRENLTKIIKMPTIVGIFNKKKG